MSYIARCPGCGHTYHVTKQHVGQTARCTTCHQTFTVTGHAGSGNANLREEDQLFAGLKLDSLLEGRKRAPQSKHEDVGFLLPEEREALRQALTSSEAPQQPIIAPIEPLAPARPRTPIAAVEPSVVVLPARTVRRVSALGLLALSLAWAWLALTNTESGFGGSWLALLAVLLGLGGAALMARGLLGFASDDPQPLGHVPTVIAAVLAVLAITLPMAVGEGPAAAKMVSGFGIGVMGVGALFIVGSSLWSLGLIVREGIVPLLLTVLVPFYATYYVYSRWYEQRPPVTLYACGLLMCLLGGSFMVTGRHEVDQAMRNPERLVVVPRSDVRPSAAAPPPPAETAPPPTPEPAPPVEPIPEAAATPTAPEPAAPEVIVADPVAPVELQPLVEAPADPPANEIIDLPVVPEGPASRPLTPLAADADLPTLEPTPGSVTYMGEYVRLGDYFFRLPREMVGRIDSTGRAGQWRGSGATQRSVGLDASVKDRDADDAELTYPIRLNLERVTEEVWVHGRWQAIHNATVDQFRLKDLVVTRVKLAEPPAVRVLTRYYVILTDTQCISFTIRFDPTRPMQLEVLESSLLTLERVAH